MSEAHLVADQLTFGIRNWLRVEVLCREFPGESDYYDGNWLNVDIRIANSASRCRYNGPYLLAQELRDFLRNVEKMHKKGKGSAKLVPLEEFWSCELSWLDERGHVRLVIDANPFPGMTDAAKSRHHYEFTADQSDLQCLARELHAVLRTFPVVKP